MRRIRVVEPTSKVICVLALALGGLALTAAAIYLWGNGFGLAIGGVVLLGAVLLTARLFRGQTESRTAPRDWWRMTARPQDGGMLALTFAGCALVLLLSTLERPSDPARLAAYDSLPALVGSIELVAIALAYAGSSVRLLRVERSEAHKGKGRTLQ